MKDPVIDHIISECGCSRRDFLRRGLYGLGVGAGLPLFLQNTSNALAAQELAGKDARHPNRILVVVELSGGNDGLNTVVPYTHDAYYKARPQIGIPKNQVRKLTDEFGLHPQLMGCERIFKEGRMAIVQGCGYPNPNLSHFTSMEYWHTAVPNGADSRGWAGRFADAKWPKPVENLIVNVGPAQKRAVQSGVHAPIVFNDPEKFTCLGSQEQKAVFPELMKKRPTKNSSLSFLQGISETAANSSELVKTACAEYRSQTNYGAGNLRNDLRRVAALIAGGFQTQIYYVSTSGWDTHAGQLAAQALHLGYLDDALTAFMIDVKRMGRADDVAVMMFSEFGRRVGENASLGTDHGTAGPMYVFGAKVKGGFYGQPPSLTDLDDGNLKMTTDFRSVYATMIKEWMGYDDTKAVLKGNYPTVGVFA